MNSLKLSLCVFLSIFGGIANSSPLSSSWFNRLADATLQYQGHGAEITASPLDRVTYTLVDTTAYLLQLGKTGLLLTETGFEDENLGPLFDVVYNTTRVRCDAGGQCAKEDIYMEFREPTVKGSRTIKVNPTIGLDRLNWTLNVENLSIDSPGYRHTIWSNATTAIRRGERAVFALRNATYGIAADYKLIAGVGIQLSNVDITLNIGEESWTVTNTFTELENGEIVDGGLYQGDLKEGVMSIWKGNYEGKPFEPQYEQWAEFVLNCGLSGGKSSDKCEQNKEHVQKFKSFFSNQ